MNNNIKELFLDNYTPKEEFFKLKVHLSHMNIWKQFV